MINIALGTYSGGVLVYKFDGKEAVCIFAQGIHTSSVRCVNLLRSAVVLSGGRDESLCASELKNGKVLGLPSPGGDVLSLGVNQRGTAVHLLVGGSKGRISVYKRKAQNWAFVGDLVGHKGPVESIAVESTGRVALTIGKAERKLRLWDLVKGTCAVSERFDTIPLKVAIANDCYYAVLFEKSVLVRCFLDGDHEKRFGPPESEKPSSLFTCLSFFPNRTLAIGTNKGGIYLVRVNSSLEIERAEVIEVWPNERIRHVEFCEDGGIGYLIVVSSSGRIGIWNFDSSNWELFSNFSAFETNALVTTVHIEIL